MVRTPGQRLEVQPCRALRTLQHAPAGQRRLAILVVDHLARAVGPVQTQGGLNLAAVGADQALDDRHISLGHAARCKSHAQRSLHCRAARENRSRTFEVMDDKCLKAIFRERPSKATHRGTVHKHAASTLQDEDARMISCFSRRIGLNGDFPATTLK